MVYTGVQHHLTHIAKTGSICEAAETGRLDVIQYLAQKVVDELGYPLHEVLSEKDSLLGAQPMHFAAENGHLHVIEWMLESKVLPSPGDSNMVSPLQLASLMGHLQIVNTLLKAGAPVRLADRDGDTALHWAAQNGHVEVMEALVRAGAVIDAANAKLLTPLHRAALKNHPIAVNWLLTQGAAINSVDESGHTAMHMACYYSSFAAIDMLMSWGAKADILDHAGLVCWQLAPSGGKGAKALIEQKQAEATEAAKAKHTREQPSLEGGKQLHMTPSQVARNVRLAIAPQASTSADTGALELPNPTFHPRGAEMEAVEQAMKRAVLPSHPSADLGPRRSSSPPLNFNADATMVKSPTARPVKGIAVLDNKRNTMGAYLRDNSAQMSGSNSHLASSLRGRIEEDSSEDFEDEVPAVEVDAPSGGPRRQEGGDLPPVRLPSAKSQHDDMQASWEGDHDNNPAVRAAARQEIDRLLSKSSSGKQRPNEANKKFLDRYGLGDARLFTP